MSALESSITLDDVFVVVGARRVPLAPELAGYLALEIAEGAQEPAGDVDPRSVYIGEEGSVALVTRPRRDGQTGDAESSVRAILGKLLEASGSQTPALGAVARRKAGGGLGSLVEELEAALIPVNRAAGRRALARLAREVKRVALGVGRNASLAPGEPSPKRGSSPSHGAVRDAPSPPPKAPGADVPSEQPMLSQPTPPPPARPPTSSDAAADLPTIEFRKEQAAAAVAAHAQGRGAGAKPGAADEVDHLLASFALSGRGDQAQRNELKALVGLDPTPPPPGSNDAYDASPPPPHESDVESLLSMSDAAPRVAPTLASRSEGLASPPTAISPQLANEAYGAPRPRAADAGELPNDGAAGRRESRAAVPTGPSARKIAEISSFHTPHAPRTSRAIVTFALIAVGAGAAALYVLQPGFFSGRAAPPSPPPPAATVAPSPAAVAAAAQAARCHASLVVQGAPDNAEILLRIGQAPVDVERMPVGARLEFVATAEGFAPKRAIVPSGATWDSGPDGKPRYEIAVQLDKSRARAGAIDNWPAGEPGSEVGGKGSPGTVHLVATPRGAEVWLLAGLGPDARIEQLKCGGDTEVLVAGPTTLRKRLHVPESAFVAKDGGDNREATVSAK